MREFVLDYAEYIIFVTLVCVGLLALDYRSKRNDREERRKFQYASLFGAIVGAAIPIIAWFFS